ncbi:MAG: HlyD family type I secretion periplasmic adaptor subunit [Desulfovibrionaceae bacterium]|jgi:adhesin transport system membrane fusion protein|nr:HlyD family type I secretion periplasmic adaptor subunit [Desulfovibrionaceae bacterium]
MQPSADQQTQRIVSRAMQLFLALLLAMTALFCVWAWYGEIDVVSTVDGEVVPSGKVKPVDHLEGGIVREILVREGDTVRRDQPLVVLEETIQGSSLQEVQVRMDSLAVEAARLEAEAEGRAPEFPPDVAERRPDLVTQAMKLYGVRQSRLRNELAGQRADIEARTKDIEKISARLSNSRDALTLLEKELAISVELRKENLTTEVKHLQLLREAANLRGRIGEDQAALARARAALQEGREKLTRLTSVFGEDARDEHKKVVQELDEFRQRERKYSDSLERTVIRSPVDGVVKALAVASPGEVVKPGGTLLEVVPSDERLVIQAHLPIQDIGYVQKGQRAIVKLPTRDARRFGQLDGVVDNISPDTFTNEQGRTYYAVRIVTTKDVFEGRGATYRLYPGMKLLAYIHTGKRTVWESVFSPLAESLSVALHER